jgi:hypothetical protein
LAVVRLAVLRFAVDRFAVLRLAVLRFAVLRFAADFLELRGGMPHLLRGLNYPAASAVRSSMRHPPDSIASCKGCDGPHSIALWTFMLQLSCFHPSCVSHIARSSPFSLLDNGNA